MYSFRNFILEISVVFLLAVTVYFVFQINQLKKRLQVIESNYTPLTVSQQRADCVNADISELKVRLSMVSFNLDKAYKINNNWIVGLTTDQIDSIKIFCNPLDYNRIAKKLRKQNK
ncbi:MAG: hypothetical protein PHF86_15030 [Candidatus Nanoarchaeia archaeon]|nr:hypothetical protein [Candidatus Nanoarchaeia archaeon]